MDDMDPPINEMCVVSDTVAISVATDGVGGVQLCPAIIIGSPQALPSASKHIYSRLAANAVELDEGMPDVILALVADGNKLSRKYVSLIESSLCPIVSSCGLWLISSGEHEDPLATAASNAIRKVLPQSDTPSEVLHLLVNSHAVIGVSPDATSLVDASLNTLLLACRREVEGKDQIARMRAHACVRLAHPPPALLIGVPSEHISSGMIPSGQAPPILLSPSNDKRPLPAAIFAGASLSSLEELLIYVENGLPVIVLQDSCELCAVLHSASLLFDISDFEHFRFVIWLENQMNIIGMEQKAVDLVVKILSLALGETQLVEFIDQDGLSGLAGKIVDMCVQCYPGDTRQVVLLAGRLNQPSALNRLPLVELLDDELMTSLLCESVRGGSDRTEFMAAVFESKPHLNIQSDMLIKMIQAADQHFFSSIILCQCMGYSSVPDEIDDEFAYHLSKMLRRLSFGVDDLFPPSSFNGDVLHKENAGSIRILAVWCLLLHRPSMVRCLCAFSEEPLAFSLVLSRIAKSLSHEARDCFFYSESLSKLSDQLAQSAVSLLDKVHSSSPQKAYQMLCQPIDGFHAHTITQLAFQSNARLVVAHESCQRWVHRLLYGHLQASNSPAILPRWIKILLSAVFIWPSQWWMAVRPPISHREDHKSPTVALLDSSRMPKRTRAVSTYSVISGRSDALTTLTAPLSVNIPMHSYDNRQLTGGAESTTPQSMVFPLNIEEPDGEPSMRFFNKKHRIRRSSPPSLSVFYSTPIVKYWLSLVFRILHIGLLAYTTLLPGCGQRSLDAVVWAWSFMWWMEAIWVLHLRSQHTDLSLMPWRVFDVTITFVFLLLLLLLKVFGEGPVAQLFYLPSVYPAKVVSSFYLLYWCYATLFFYIPLSDIFGPLIVRVKLMILRDFTNFLIMIALIMASSAAAIHAVLYPDRELSISYVQSALSWAWLSLFTTDLSSLKESDQCRKSFLGSPKDYCSSVGEYGNPTCPSQSWPAYFVVLEYFVLLKLILWPILFAFFAKTAKAVDDEADTIWKYQMYSLVTEFSMRPPLPPPLSPLFFLFLAFCRARNGIFTMSFTNIDHPDMTHKSRVTSRFGAIYRNPSVPFKKNEFVNSFWRRLAIEQWRGESQRKRDDGRSETERTIREQLRIGQLTTAYRKMEGNVKQFSSIPYSCSTSILRLLVPPESSPWIVLLPRYSPPFYCRPIEEFPMEMTRFVENVTEQSVSELRRSWRSRQVSEQGSKGGWTIAANGFPLNPNGRRGIAGRGNHPRFGSNKQCHYIIISGTTKSEAKVLLSDSLSLPSEPHPEGGARDDRLAAILRISGIGENDVQVLSMRRLDTSLCPDDVIVAASDTSPAHISVDTVQHDDDTDNAWTEHDVWAVALRSRKVSPSMIGYHWQSVTSLSIGRMDHIQKALRIFGLE